MIRRAQAAWKNPQILFTLLMVFASGAISGAVIYRLSSQAVSAKIADAPWDKARRQMTLEFLKKELVLTPEQTSEIATVLDDYSLYIQMLDSQMKEALANGKKNIEAVLNEEQKVKFARIMSDARHSQLR